MIVLLGTPNMITETLNSAGGRFFGFTAEQHSPREYGEVLYSGITIYSALFQNFPFLVIRIVVWVQYELYSLGFLVKNLTVIVLYIAILVKNGRKLFKNVEN